ncbi:TPA_asm: protein-export chaperone SecB [Listeria monocytogenes]|nr:protein-export chaperone SecB [Listeria monocytogenes]
MAVLKFHTYLVREIRYINNDSFENKSNDIEMSPTFKVEILFDEERAMVDLYCEMGEGEEVNTPFKLNVCLRGIFTYNDEENSEQTFSEYLKTNAIAIMFPYLRALISDVTSKSNLYPTYTLPVINIVKLLEENDLITVHNAVE